MKIPRLPTLTASLALAPLQPSDVDDVFRVYSDAATWRHLPAGRHERREQSRELIESSRESWHEVGLGQWAIRRGATGSAESPAAGTFIGTGGATMTAGGVWNLGYRLSPGCWGRGFATELARAAVDAAADRDLGRPITARVLSNNTASAVVALRVGLALVWEGPTTAQVDGEVQGQIYSDRPLSPGALEWLILHV